MKQRETEDYYQEDLQLEIKIGGYMLDIMLNDYVYLQSPHGDVEYYEWGDRKSWETRLSHLGILSRVSAFFGKLSSKTGNYKQSKYSSRSLRLVEMA